MTPRKRRTPDDEIELAHIPPIETPPAPPTPATPVLTLTEERRTAELEDIIDEIGSESRVRVWQIVEGKSSFAGEMSGDGFTLDALLDAYGGGDKALAIYQGRVCVSRVRVSLDPTIPAKNPRQPKLPTGAVPAPNGSTDAMQALLTGIAAQQIQSAQAMASMMTGIVGALTTVMTATKPQKDPMEMAVELMKVMRPSGGEGSSPSDFLSALKQGIDIGERIGGSKEDDDGVMTAVNKGLDTLGIVVQGVLADRHRQNQQPALPVAQPVQPVQPSPIAEPVMSHESTDFPGQPFGPGDTVTEGPAIPEPVTGTIRPWVAAARPYIGQLFAASRFMKPDAAASTIADNLDDDQFFDLMDDLQDETGGGFGVRLRQYFPREVENTDPEWIGEVLRILITEHLEDDDDAPAAPSAEPPKPA